MQPLLNAEILNADYGQCEEREILLERTATGMRKRGQKAEKTLA